MVTDGNGSVSTPLLDSLELSSHDIVESILISMHLVLMLTLWGPNKLATAPDIVLNEAVVPSTPLAYSSPTRTKLGTTFTSSAFKFKSPASTANVFLTISCGAHPKNSIWHSLATKSASTTTLFSSCIKRCRWTRTEPNQAFSCSSRNAISKSPLLIIIASLSCFSTPRSRTRSASHTIWFPLNNIFSQYNRPPSLTQMIDVLEINTLPRTWRLSRVPNIALSSKIKSPWICPSIILEIKVQGLTTFTEPATFKCTMLAWSCEQSWMSSEIVHRMVGALIAPCLHWHIIKPPRMISLLSWSNTLCFLLLSSSWMFFPWTRTEGSISSLTADTNVSQSMFVTARSSLSSLKEEVVFGFDAVSFMKPWSFFISTKLSNPLWAVSCFESEHNIKFLAFNSKKSCADSIPKFVKFPREMSMSNMLVWFVDGVVSSWIFWPITPSILMWRSPVSIRTDKLLLLLNVLLDVSVPLTNTSPWPIMSASNIVHFNKASVSIKISPLVSGHS